MSSDVTQVYLQRCDSREDQITLLLIDNASASQEHMPLSYAIWRVGRSKIDQSALRTSSNKHEAVSAVILDLPSVLRLGRQSERDEAQVSDLLAPPAGVEPAAYRLGGGRSIH